MNDLVATERLAHAPGAGRWAAARWRAVCLIAVIAFGGLGLSAFASGVLPGDLSVRAGLLVEDRTALHEIARWVNLAGTWRVLLPAFALLLLSSSRVRNRWWLWCAVLPAAGLVEKVMKFLVDRPRPSGFSLGYPSGHTTSAAAFAVILLYVSTRERLHPSARLALQVVAVAGVALVGWARIVLHAHWPTDVLGGMLLGTACAAGAAWWDSAHGART
jgi:undecaprenyl-diphosphatase